MRGVSGKLAGLGEMRNFLEEAMMGPRLEGWPGASEYRRLRGQSAGGSSRKPSMGQGFGEQAHVCQVMVILLPPHSLSTVTVPILQREKLRQRAVRQLPTVVPISVAAALASDLDLTEEVNGWKGTARSPAEEEMLAGIERHLWWQRRQWVSVGLWVHSRPQVAVLGAEGLTGRLFGGMGSPGFPSGCHVWLI